MHDKTHKNLKPNKYEKGYTVVELFGESPQLRLKCSPLKRALTIFLLGIYLGRVAKENGWFYGMAMLTAGAFTALIVFVIQLF